MFDDLDARRLAKSVSSMVGQPKQLARPRFGRAVMFRILAVLLGLSPFLIGEAVCRWFDLGQPRARQDPFVGFAQSEPLFVPSADATRFEIPVHRQAFFAPESFAQPKPADEFRIFCLGGSTVQGRPYSNKTSFTKWLELSLRAADDTRQWKVVNCGGVSYASYRLVPILEEVLTHRPDMIIVYTGHNEFLEDRTYHHLKTSPPLVHWTYRVLSSSRLFSTVSQAWRKPTARDGLQTAQDGHLGRALLPAEVDALLDYQGGLESYERDDDWRDDVVRHFDWNLRRIAKLCRDSRVPLLLINPVSNLKDCPPFKIVVNPTRTAQQGRAFDSLWRQARQPDISEARRIELLRDALKLDPRHAGARYLLGKSYEAQQRSTAALGEFNRAKDEDACPLRMLERMHAALRGVAEVHNVPLIDVRKRFALESPGQLVGDEWMLDHVHPSIRGHQMIAEMLVGELKRGKHIEPRDDWKSTRGDLYRRHLGSLDAAYFARGKEKLEGLRRWTQGRVNKLRVVPQASAP